MDAPAALHILSSVRVGVVEDLARALERRLTTPVTVEAAMSDAAWRRARGGGALASAVARIAGLTFPFRAVVRRRRPGDVVIATTNPFWLPTALALRGGCRLVVLVYDVYPDALLARWRLPVAIRRAIDAVVGAGLRRADAVVTLGRRVSDELAGRHRLSAAPHVIPTGADPDDFSDADPSRLPVTDLGDGVLVSYVGNTGSVHDGATLGAALARVLESDTRIRAVVATRGDRAAELTTPLAGNPGATVRAELDDAEYRATMARSDIALVSLGSRAAVASVPSKVYAALAAGCAVIAIAPRASDLADLVAQHDVGAVVEPGDVHGAVDAVRALVGDRAQRSRHSIAARTAAARFTPEVLAGRWVEVLAPLLAHRRRR